MGKNNQKTVRKLWKQPCDKNNIYATINIAAMEQAALNLELPAFKLWTYFAKNNEKYRNWDLSSKHIETSYGMKRAQYNNAMKELIEKGYLVPIESENAVANLWDFHEVPQTSQEAETDKAEDTLVLSQSNPLFSDKTTPCFETNQGLISDKSTNITDNTIHTTEDTTGGTSLAGGANKVEQLEEMVGADGSYKDTWFDEVIPFFNNLSNYQKVEAITRAFSEFSKEDAKYIVNKILE